MCYLLFALTPLYDVNINDSVFVLMVSSELAGNRDQDTES